MNGRFLLDTNAVVALLNGNGELTQILNSATWVGISIMTELEFLAFSGLSKQDVLLFQEFKTRIEIIDLQSKDTMLIQEITSIRKSGNLKMPDAIIVASALQSQATLLTQDAQLLKLDNFLVRGF